MVIECLYPTGVDLMWMAVDRLGNVAAFITAGSGPIPLDALKTELGTLQYLENRLCMLAEIGAAQVLVVVPRPDDFIDLANRGFFVYDWTDVHKSNCAENGAYELVAIPTKPILDVSLPSEILQVAGQIKFSDIQFQTNPLLHVEKYFLVAERS